MALLSYALCSVSDVQDTPGVDAALSVSYIERKINQATEVIEGYCQRRFAETQYTTEEYNGTFENDLILRQRPITLFTSLEVRNTALNSDTWSTIDPVDYFIDYNAGILRAVASFYGYFNRWRVTYKAGFATIPADLREACSTLAAYLAKQNTGQSVKRMREGSREIEYNQALSGNSGNSSLINDLGLDEILARYADTVFSGGR